MGRRAVLLVIIVLAASSLLVMPVPARHSSIPKPSVPEFTLKLVNKSYDVPTNTSTSRDPCTNKTTNTTILGYHVKDFEIEINIKNQPFMPCLGEHNLTLFYSVCWGTTVGENGGTFWSSLSSWRFSPPSFRGLFPANSTSEYTMLFAPANYQPNTKVAFRVEAILGYEYTLYSPSFFANIGETIFVHESSGWSDTQTVAIPNTLAVASTVSPTVFPESPLLSLSWEQVAIIILIILAVVQMAISVVLLRRKREVTTNVC